ncbi:MAG TPA: hypothetical protein PLR74_17820 [Agriterribacter sp.]|nr:hypothetical protein [Agriterribacter sp.]
MALRLGDQAPNFQAKTSVGEIDFYEYLGGGWGVLFSPNWEKRLCWVRSLPNAM